MTKNYQSNLPILKNAGFTLIELLVVVLIIGILSAVALPQYQVAVAKSRTAEAVTILKAITDAQEVYYMANGMYTNDLADLDIGVKDSNTWRFFCKEQRTCFAYPKVNNLPEFIEFHLQHVPSTYPATHSGKHWCRAKADNSTGVKICKTYGQQDPTMTGYYLMN